MVSGTQWKVNQAKGRFSALGAQLQEKGQCLSEQAKTQLTGVSSQLKERGQQLGATVQAKTSEAQTLLNCLAQTSLKTSFRPDTTSPDSE